MKELIVKPFFFVFCLVFILNCSGNEQVKFTSSQSLTGAPVKEITVFSEGNVYLNVVDTFLVVATSRDVPFLRIYSTNTHKLLKEYGKEGRGPRDFLSVTPLRKSGYDAANDSPVLYVHDFKRNKIAGINLKRLINGNETFSLETPLNDQKYLTFVHYWDEDLLVGSPGGGGNILIHNLTTDNFYNVSYLPKLDFTIPDNILSLVYRSAVVVNKKRGLIASAPQYLGELDFFDFQGNLIRSSIFESRDAYRHELTSGLTIMNDIKKQIIDLDAKKDLIYGLNYNVHAKDYRSGKWNSKVQVFDWNGNAIIEYPLDGRPVRYFAVDEIHSRIYAYDPTEEEHNVVVYEFD
ncbi:MAG: hypothetical protein FH748_16130 [Balneolaceae bacterium]|nr:hypothetical protein [Balneolaceae bacterium]